MNFTIGIGPNIRKSAYFDATLRDGVRGFSVYNHMYIPSHFGDPEGEYDLLMTGVAMWDVAAQRQVQLAGPDADKLAQYLTPRDLSKTKVGQGRYVTLCDHDGWLINDPVLLKLSEKRFWLSVADSDIHLWATALGREKGWDVEVSEPDVSPLAIQGPKAVEVAAALFGDRVREFRYFGFEETDLDGIPLVLARSGWSKQGGYELYLMDHTRGSELWDKVKQAGAAYGIGPGAPNDTERLESGLISYGADMRWQTHPATPFEMGLGGMVDLEAGHEFVGRAALSELAKNPPSRVRVGVVIDGNPPIPGAPVQMKLNADEIGFVSEVAVSKRLGKTIGIGLIRAELAEEAEGLQVLIDGIAYPAHLHAIPFVK
ncbi:Aminomethyl transferase family protein [Sulfitobacter noctilucae]|uniref:glycine cleavage T C-terminal barrel domain-containing protein n=1 Tax=Sulfitobacter noctilucae TaxID=1342302 RepID=UPI00046859D9|nr:glycine cleavage T C-terminal barrel domain-containing protein [Sulfitobacter noctilucae]KIN60056.1 Aminomethyl transferase family protein [Sulfitobacter noctilucae]